VSNISFPFLTLSADSISAGPWEVSLDGKDSMLLGQYTPDWDKNTEIRFKRLFRVDFDRASEELRIPRDDLKLSLSVQVGTGSGRLPRVVTQQHDEVLTDAELLVEVTPVSRNLSMIVDMRTDVYLPCSPSRRSDLSPHSVGDILWSDRSRSVLEGTEPRFPIETIDFASLPDGQNLENSPWYVSWSANDWHTDFYGAMRLYLNERFEDLVQKVRDRDPLVLQAILGDALSQVCEAFVLEQDAEELMLEHEQETLAAQTVSWLEMAWPGADVTTIRSLLKQRPGLFRSTLLALVHLTET